MPYLSRLGLTKRQTMYYILACVVITLLSVTYRTYQDNLLKANGEYTNAIIERFGEKGKYGRTKFFKHKYIVDGIEYKGGGKWFPNRDTLAVGDTIIIMYNKKNPAQSRTKRNFELKWWQ